MVALYNHLFWVEGQISKASVVRDMSTVLFLLNPPHFLIISASSYFLEKTLPTKGKKRERKSIKESGRQGRRKEGGKEGEKEDGEEREITANFFLITL